MEIYSMIIVDKLGKKVVPNCRIAIAEVTLNGSFNYVPRLSFATVIAVNKKSLSIQYENSCIDNDFISKEFVIIQGEVINLYNYSTLEKELKQVVYTKGFINV